MPSFSPSPPPSCPCATRIPSKRCSPTPHPHLYIASPPDLAIDAGYELADAVSICIAVLLVPTSISCGGSTICDRGSRGSIQLLSAHHHPLYQGFYLSSRGTWHLTWGYIGFRYLAKGQLISTGLYYCSIILPSTDCFYIVIYIGHIADRAKSYRYRLVPILKPTPMPTDISSPKSEQVGKTTPMIKRIEGVGKSVREIEWLDQRVMMASPIPPLGRGRSGCVERVVGAIGGERNNTYLGKMRRWSWEEDGGDENWKGYTEGLLLQIWTWTCYPVSMKREQNDYHGLRETTMAMEMDDGVDNSSTTTEVVSPI
ncbi:B1135C02.11 [Oryza sativa (japonica cultivar-group)]